MKNNQRYILLLKILVSFFNGRISSFLLLCCFFWVISAASFSGYFGKWAFFDENERLSLDKMIEGTAHKPFVYRQLMPVIVNKLDSLTPEKLKTFILKKYVNLRPHMIYKKAILSNDTRYEFIYLVLYYMVFFSMFFSLFILRQILLDCNISMFSATTVPAFFLLSLPYIQTYGGYFYDSTELLFFALTVLLSLRGKFIFLFPVVVLATLNKETYIFFLFSIYPFLRKNFTRKKSVSILSIMILCAGLINILIKYLYSKAPAKMAEFQLISGISHYLHLKTYFSFEVTYGIIGPGGAFLGTLIILAMIIIRGWPHCNIITKKHILISAAINLPLFIIFCFPGELRNLSILYIGITILIAGYLDQVIFKNITLLNDQSESKESIQKFNINIKNGEAGGVAKTGEIPFFNR